MEFKLKGELRASGSLEELKERLASWVEELNKDLLIRGAKKPEDGARISEWVVDGNRLLLTIESGKAVRAHSALLRVRSFLSQRLGRYRLGVRGLKAEEVKVYLDRLTMSAEEARRLLEGLAEVHVLESGGYMVVFKELSGRDLEKGIVDRVLRKIVPVEAVVKETEKPHYVPMGYVLKRSPRKEVKFDGEVSEWAERLGWAKRYPGRGQWILAAPTTALLRCLTDMIIERILRPMGFEEWMLPKLTPMTVMARMPGYFDKLAEGMIYAFTPEREEEALKDFKRRFALTGELDLESLRREVGGPGYVLEPAQCTPFYQFFSGEIVNLDDLPVKIFDRSGWTWRWEGKATRGLERTIEFFRLEAVWMAEPKEAARIRDEVAYRSMEFADKILDLEVRMVVGAPFYMSGDEAAKTQVDISSSERVPTLDLEAWLPYRGSREDSEWLEIGAYSCHRDKYVKSFRVKEAKGRDVWTGCAGFGMTRWITAFLAQKGFNPDDWPGEIRRRLGKLPEPVKTVTWPRG